MIPEFVKAWDEKKSEIEKSIRRRLPVDYRELVELVISILPISSDKLHEINDGRYDGTLLYLIPKCNNAPEEYYYVKIFYGSCSGCDTLEAISVLCDKDGGISERQIKEYMMLALHIVQNFKVL